MRKNRVSLFRRAIQLSVLSLLLLFLGGNLLGFGGVNFEAYCPMGGIQSILTLIQDGILACNMTATQLVLGSIFLMTVLLLGKLFCSHLCPLGTVSEYLGKLGERFSVRMNIPDGADKVLRSLKYILLFITLTLTLKTGELFCKEYDPFYASFSLFGHRVNFLYASISITVFLLGSIFFRLFWCKYLCPLGAISNIFKYWVGVVMVVVIIASVYFFELGIDISIVVALICVTGYVLEIFKIDTKQKVMLKIIRHPHSCVDCGLCSRTCPQGIDVADLEVVKHPDCNVCGDCVSSCPKEGALTLNQSLNINWLPSVLVVVLLLTGLFFGNQLELPTVSKAWGSPEEMQRSKEFELDYLRNITCFSSSMGFVRQMKEVDGILGISTFISSHSAKIRFDTTKISELSIRKMLYSRSKEFIQEPQSPNENILVYKLRIEKYLEKEDLALLAQTLKTQPIYQIETQFDNEIQLLVFCNESLSESNVEELINGVKVGRKTPFKVKDVSKSSRSISGVGLMKRTFIPLQLKFNKMNTYPQDQLRAFEVQIGEYPKNEQQLNLLINHLGKKYAGVVGIDAYFDSIPKARFFYVKDSVDTQTILETINQKQLTLTYTNGETENIANPFTFNVN